MPAATEDIVVVNFHKLRKGKSRVERKLHVRGKAGNQGRFQKNIQDFLSTFVSTYAMIGRGTKGKNKALNDFWYLMRNQFWEKFTLEDARVGLPNEQALSDQEVTRRTNEVGANYL